MSTEALTLTDFLSARLAEDERHARKLAETDQRPALSLATTVNHPGRLLAECAAKREILAGLTAPMPEIHTGIRGRFERDAVDWAWRVAREGTLAFLALPYADHPDYRSEWRP